MVPRTGRRKTNYAVPPPVLQLASGWSALVVCLLHLLFSFLYGGGQQPIHPRPSSRLPRIFSFADRDIMRIGLPTQDFHAEHLGAIDPSSHHHMSQMAGQNGISHAQGRRGPKYRTSCDRCQAAKVKCGHEKPSCRRCTYHKVECVYGISRRMGRPRAKKNSGKDASPSPQGSINGASDENSRSKSATPAPVSFTGTEPITEARQSPVANAEGGRISRAESTQRAEPWTPSLTTNFEHPETSEGADDSAHGPMMQSMNTPLTFLPTENRMELDDFNDYPPMSSFMEDLADPMMSQQPISAPPSLDILDPHALIPDRTPTGNTRDTFNQVDTGLSVSLPQTTQLWNTSQAHQLHALFESNSTSKSKRRASTGQEISGIVSFNSVGHSNSGFGNKRMGELQIATGPLVSIGAGEQSAMMNIGPNPDTSSVAASRKFAMEEEDDPCSEIKLNPNRLRLEDGK
uniref:Transcription factor verZ n=1 Tax=Clonostachys rogersoniana TaxID=122658 RepID=VERZ_CLORO|nr:RecName: Full=Transcription factor verZ; AltName: Full=Verticillin biosynthesis cluster protein Z [Clonostachys rogersoniana]AQZ42167.1 putative zinc finger [Gliocladium sp.]